MSDDHRNERWEMDTASKPPAVGRAGHPALSCEELTDHIVSYFIDREALNDRPAILEAVEWHLKECSKCASKSRSLQVAIAAMAPPSPEMTEWAWSVLREAARDK